MNDEKLFKLGKPSLYIVATDESLFTNLYQQLTMQRRDSVIRMIRGKKSMTISSFFDEVAAVLQFPYYFGENWAAFSECITDLDWIEGDAYLLMVTNAHMLLSNADSEDFDILIQKLTEANIEWLTPNQYIPRNRQPTPFHILFQCPESDVTRFSERLEQLGAEFEIVNLPES